MNTKKITKKQLKYILGKDRQEFKENILNNCHCSHCNDAYNSTIIDWQASLNDLDDVVLKGKCAECGSLMNRYVEIGEVLEYAGRIEEVKK